VADEIPTYLKTIEKELRRGDATEHTHRAALKELVESLKSGITATNEPKQIECGAPDYSVSRSTKHGPLTIGYIETKDVGAALSDEQKSDQLKRYRTLPNLILTDYLEFRWFVDGDLRESARLATARATGKLTRDPGGETKVLDILKTFLTHGPEPITKPSVFAERLARLTHFVRDMVVTAFRGGKASQMLAGLREAFAEALIPDLDKPAKLDEFADMYAQTIAYGLFAARCNHAGQPESFKRLGAACRTGAWMAASISSPSA